MNGSENVQVTVRFITIMQKYSEKGNRDVEITLPSEPRKAIDYILEQFRIPWKGELETWVRIFINGVNEQTFYEQGTFLKEGDVIAFIPISSGG